MSLIALLLGFAIVALAFVAGSRWERASQRMDRIFSKGFLPLDDDEGDCHE